VPVAAVLGIGLMGRPHDNVWLARRDLLVAAGASVGLGGLGAGEAAHHVVIAAPLLDPFAEHAARTLDCGLGVRVATVVAGHDSIFAEAGRPRR
jgi:hypothetical protein